jgi:signal transduction histidine kinase
MRTLSARILLGFAALTVAFGVITATVVVNMRKVELEIRLVHTGDLPLALVSKDLDVHQRDLKSYLEEAFADEVNPGNARNNLNRIRGARDTALLHTNRTLDGIDPSEADPLEYAIPRTNIAQLQAQFVTNGPAYAKLDAALLASPDAMTSAEVTAELAHLQNAERRMAVDTGALASSLEFRVRRKMLGLEDREHALRLATIYLGLVAIALGLFITIWVVITLRPLRVLRAAARRVAAGSYDSRIVERGPAEVADLAREFNSMARAVEERERGLVRSERLAAVGKMAAMITHEVRNPLSSIGLNTELLEEELGKADGATEARALCTSIHREVDRLTAITEEYLSFARLPKPKIAHEPVNAMVDALATFVREDLATKHVELTVELGDGDPKAMIDAAQLRQCLLNLVRNAADAVAAKGRGRVTLRTRRTGERIVIEVEDDGIGIPADVLPKLFDPFFSTKEGGSGLGLALTQQIVKDHGGDLEVTSTVGKGTTFRMSVPASR